VTGEVVQVAARAATEGVRVAMAVGEKKGAARAAAARVAGSAAAKAAAALRRHRKEPRAGTPRDLPTTARGGGQG